MFAFFLVCFIVGLRVFVFFFVFLFDTMVLYISISVDFSKIELVSCPASCNAFFISFTLTVLGVAVAVEVVSFLLASLHFRHVGCEIFSVCCPLETQARGDVWVEADFVWMAAMMQALSVPLETQARGDVWVAADFVWMAAMIQELPILFFFSLGCGTKPEAVCFLFIDVCSTDVAAADSDVYCTFVNSVSGDCFFLRAELLRTCLHAEQFRRWFFLNGFGKNVLHLVKVLHLKFSRYTGLFSGSVSSSISFVGLSRRPSVSANQSSRSLTFLPSNMHARICVFICVCMCGCSKRYKANNKQKPSASQTLAFVPQARTHYGLM